MVVSATNASVGNTGLNPGWMPLPDVSGPGQRQALPAGAGTMGALNAAPTATMDSFSRNPAPVPMISPIPAVPPSPIQPRPLATNWPQMPLPLMAPNGSNVMGRPMVPGAPMTPVLTMMPVVRTIAPPVQPGYPANVSGMTDVSGAITPPEVQVVGDAASNLPVGATGAVEPAGDAFVAGHAEPDKPLTPEEETGQRIGQIATRILEANPQLQARLEASSLDEYLADPQLLQDQVRGVVQPLLRAIPDPIENRLWDRVPLEYQADAQALRKWVNQPITTRPPAVKSRSAEPSALGHEDLGGDPLLDSNALSNDEPLESTAAERKSRKSRFSLKRGKEEADPAPEIRKSKSRHDRKAETDPLASLDELLAGDPFAEEGLI